MPVAPAIPDPQNLRRELLNAKVFPSAPDLHLEVLLRNSARRDFERRATFRIHDGQRSLGHLTVGPGLANLWRRTREFAAACPDIAPQPLFLHSSGAIDYLGVEFIEGSTLEQHIRGDRISPSKTMDLLQQVVHRLESTLTPSTSDAAARELEALLDRICRSPLFGALDHRFLSDLVFPLIRAAAGNPAPRQRWTNGDLIARNIIIDATGRPRLVDFEFAQQTHFYGEDAWRWRMIADIPTTHRAFPSGPTADQTAPWLDALFLLNQMALAHDINGAPAALNGSAAAIADLVERVLDAHTHFQASVFYRGLASSATGRSTRPVFCQLFWSEAGIYTEESSRRCELATGRDITVAFRFPGGGESVRLRFDPADAPAVLTLYSVRVRQAQTGEEVRIFNAKTGWDAIDLGDGLHRLTVPPHLNLLSLNDDPKLLLPSIPLPPGVSDLVCEIDLRLTPEFLQLPALLHASTAHEKSAREAELEATLAQTTAHLESARSDLQSAHVREHEFAATIATVQTESTDLRTRSEELYSDLAACQRQRDEALITSDEQATSLAEVVRELDVGRAQQEELSAAFMACQRQRDEALNSFASLTERFVKAVRELDDGRARHNELSDSLTVCQRQRDEAHVTVGTQAARIVNFANELNALRAQHEELSTALTNCQRQRDEISASAEAQAAQLAKLNRETEVQRAQHDEAARASTAIVATAHREIARLAAELEAAQADNQAIKAAYGTVVHRVEQQRHEHAANQEHNRREFEEQLAGRQHRLADSETALAYVTDQLMAAQALSFQKLKEAEQARAYFEDKCARMAGSFSWRLTASLRLFRRTFLDPMRRQRAIRSQ